MHGNINLTQIQTFLWVASLKSFRKTAEKMNTTQPAISARIARLEETLGVRLFERDTSFIRLTQKGVELLPYAEKLLRTSALLVDHICSDEERQGALRLGISEMVVHTCLPEFVGSLSEKFPSLELEIVVDTTVNLRREISEKTLDFAFLMGPVVDFQIENHELLQFETIWAASPALRLSTDRPLSLDELTVRPIITFAQNTRLYAELTRQLRKTTERPARLFPVVATAAIRRLALDGVGVATLPRQMIRDDLEQGRLQEIKCSWRLPPMRFMAAYPTEPYNPMTEKIIAHALDTARRYQQQLKR